MLSNELFYFFVFVAAVLVFYTGLISLFLVGWRKTYSFVPKGDEKYKHKISVVVACRNEESNIHQLLVSLSQQSNQNFELILVDDHSDDKTVEIIKKAQQTMPNLVLHCAEGKGKKNAIKEGVALSTTEFIVTTDADCQPSYHWLETIYCFQQKKKCDLIICPVKLSGGFNLISYLQVLEFTSLIASAAGATGIGMPVMCNGANMAYRKSAWLKAQGNMHHDEISGDDMFLLESVKRQKGKIRFLKSESAFVTTSAPVGVRGFVRQRRRWSSKYRSYSDWQIIMTALIVFFMSVNLVALIGLTAINPTLITGSVLAAVFLFKYVVDTVFLSCVGRFFNLNNVWFFSLILSIVYPFYVSVIAISSLFYRQKKWN